MSVVDTPIENAEDTGLSDAAQTSTDNDVDLEDMDITFDDLVDGDSDEEDDSAATEVSEAEQSEEADGEDEADEADSTETQVADAEDTTENVDAEAERKRFNDEMAKRRIAEREAREAERQAKAALEAEHIRQYLAEAEGDPEEEALRKVNVEAYRLQQERAAINAERLQVGIDKALANETVMSIFKHGSDAAKRELLEALDEFEQTRVTKDAQGNPLQVNGDIYKTLVKKAESIRELTQAGAVQEAKTKDKAREKTITPPTRAPKQPKADAEIDAFDKAFGF